MTAATDAGYITEATLANATPLTLTALDFSNSRNAFIQIKNSGANAIGTIAVEKTADGSVWSTDTALGAYLTSLGIASGAVLPIELVDIAFKQIRFTLTSASGSKAIIYYRGT